MDPFMKNPPMDPIHPGLLVAKVGYFGVKSAKVPPGQMGTKPANGAGRIFTKKSKAARRLKTTAGP